MKSIYKLLEEKVKKALDENNYSFSNVVINESNRRDLGEYQFNGAMNLASIYHESPISIANKLVETLKKDSFFKNINVAGPGFINLTIADDALINFVNENKFKYDKKNKLIFLDYGGANVAKSLHVGHLRSANIGEALKRLCKFMGYNTISDAHLGDFGRPLGLVILELSKRYPDWPYFQNNYNGEECEVEITNQLLEEVYPYASNKAKEDENYLKEAQEMTTRLQNKEKGIYDLWKHIMRVSKKDIQKIYDRLGAKFDLYNGESNAEDYVEEMLDYLYTLNIIRESDGAQVIDVKEDSDKLDIPPMLLIKSDGGILYSTTELATIYDRIKNYNPDEIWYIVDNRQELHFTQVFRAAYKANIAKTTKLVFAGFGTMNGSDGKPFKTRDGGVMRLEELLDLVNQEENKKLNENITDNREKICEDISMGAVKYADLLPNRESDYIFDISKFSELEGKTGPYIVYSTIRMKSLLSKNDFAYNNLKVIDNELDRDVLYQINNLDKVLQDSFNFKSLNFICEYLYNLTTAYNRFYSANNILNESDLSKKESWLYLTNKVYEINSILLEILAISIPQKM